MYYPKGDTIKLFIYCCVFALLTVASFPITAEAFSRRPHHDEVPQHFPPPHNDVGLNTPGNDTPVSVPEPSSVFLLGIGICLLGIASMKERFREQDFDREKGK